ncbi:MAG TPA: DUF5985 family protein [Thermoanaerobaculia bacterium]|jgi:4-amino-4-deoxy-L-arabinose transferase-like glycosyltransferase
MNGVLAGAVVMGYAVAALYFLRFWRTSHDRLFALFAAAFAIFAVQRLAISLTRETMEDQTVFYLLRLAGFIMILLAIVEKNRE